MQISLLKCISYQSDLIATLAAPCECVVQRNVKQLGLQHHSQSQKIESVIEEESEAESFAFACDDTL
jgi:hypothetical protein